MKMEATCSSETSVDFQRTTRRYIPEERTFLYLRISHDCQNKLNISIKPTALWLETLCVPSEVGTDI
jgi:hypothetical protein